MDNKGKNKRTRKCKRVVHTFQGTADPRYLKCLWCDAIKFTDVKLKG